MIQPGAPIGSKQLIVLRRWRVARFVDLSLFCVRLFIYFSISLDPQDGGGGNETIFYFTPAGMLLLPLVV